MWKWLKRREPLIIVIGTPVLAKTAGGPWIRGVVKSIKLDHRTFGVLMAGASDIPNNYLWFDGDKLKLDESAWKKE